MAGLGIVFGLAGALLSAVSFVFSRRFIVRGHGQAVSLLVLGHVMMGLVAVTFATASWNDAMSDVGHWAPKAALAAATYLVGNVAFFFALGRTEASRVAPLLGLKLVAVAVLAIFVLGEDVSTIQWLAVALTVSAAFVLNRVGGSVPASTILAIAFAVICFSTSDVYIRATIDALGPPDQLATSLRALAVIYILCGSVAVILLPWFGSARGRDWKAAAPYAGIWYLAMVCFYFAMATAGVVLGNIAWSTRGLFAIFLGGLLARAGFVHLEQKVNRGVLVRRALAAAMMVGAIVLYGA